jgi:hypothetical protein
MRFVRFKQFREDTSFAAAVPANAVGAGTAIANIDPMLKKKSSRPLKKKLPASVLSRPRKNLG